VDRQSYEDTRAAFAIVQALLLGEDRDLRPDWDAIIAGTWPDLPYPEALVQALGGVAALAKTCLDELTRLALHPTIPGHSPASVSPPDAAGHGNRCRRTSRPSQRKLAGGGDHGEPDRPGLRAAA